MPSLSDVVAALYGAWRLMRFDKGGMRWFDVSITGFWRSFFAAVPVAPFYAVVIALELAARIEPYNMGWAILVSIIAYVVGWAAFPIVAIFVTRLLGLAPRYVPFIIAYNWANVPQTLVYFPVIVIGADRMAPQAITEFFAFAVTLYVLIYQWFVTRTALDTTTLTATGIVILQVVIDILIHRSASGLI